MSVALLRFKNEEDPDTIDLSENVASYRFYNEFWEPAIKETGVKVFQEDSQFNKSQVDRVLKELSLLKEWAKANLEGIDLKYMKERIENLERVIPTAFEDEDTILYIC